MNVKFLRRYIRRANEVLASIEAQNLNPEAVAAGKPIVALVGYVAERMEAGIAPDTRLVADAVFQSVTAIAPVNTSWHWTASIASTAVRAAVMGLAYAIVVESNGAGAQEGDAAAKVAEQEMLRAEDLIRQTLPVMLAA